MDDLNDLIDDTPKSQPTIKKNTHIQIGIISILLIVGYIISLFTPIINLGLILCTLGGLGYLAFKVWKDLNDNINNIGKKDDLDD